MLCNRTARRAAIAICLLIASTVSTHYESNAFSASNIDWIKSSENWWGVSIEDFPSAAGLGPGEYQQGDHPIGAGLKVIAPVDNVTASWEPTVLRPSFFKFAPKEGLVEILGFYKGKKDDVVSFLTKRYGKHSKELAALGFVTYVWVFKKTALEVSDISYTVFPADKMRQ